MRLLQDGGATIGNVYELVAHLAPHVRVVDHEHLIDLALQRHALEQWHGAGVAHEHLIDLALQRHALEQWYRTPIGAVFTPSTRFCRFDCFVNC